MSDYSDVMHPDPIERVEIALRELKAGKMIILVDDEDRENEGDLVILADRTRPEDINFMAREACGLICVSMTSEQVSRLQLPMMATNNKSQYETAFTVSIEAREGVSTGISAADRAHTIQVAINPNATPRDIVVPGHMFPLRARDGGVLERVGQTEGSVDLAKLVGGNPAAVICEIMLEDGSMARLPQLLEFGRKHDLKLCAVADIIKYRMRTERVVERVREGELEVPSFGTWHARLYKGATTEGYHLALWKGVLSESATLARVQAAPPAWAWMGSDLSSLSDSARRAMEKIAETGQGALVYMHLGGPNPSFFEDQFSKDFHGVTGGAAVPKASALRDLGMGCQILRDLGLKELRLLTNSDRPIAGIESYGLSIAERETLRG